MVDQGHLPPATDRGTYFSHKDLPEQARLAGVLGDGESEQLEFLESERVVADYFPDDVTEGVATECLRSAEQIVTRTTGAGP